MTTRTSQHDRGNMQPRRGFALARLLLAAALTAVVATTGCYAEAPGSDPAATTSAATTAATTQAALEKRAVAITVTADDAVDADLAGSIVGTDANGEDVSTSVSLTPGEPHTVMLAPGTYTLTLPAISFEDECVAYAELSHDFTVGEGGDEPTVSAELPKDEEATEALVTARDERIAAEEAARQKAEEEERRAAQERAAREAEAQRQREAAAAAEANSETVYITKTGKKYHRDGCQYLRKSKIPISLSKARSQGYEPCSRCF